MDNKAFADFAEQVRRAGIDIASLAAVGRKEDAAKMALELSTLAANQKALLEMATEVTDPDRFDLSALNGKD